MVILISSFVIFLVMISALAAGVLAGRSPIRGSCGGVAGQCQKGGRDSVHCMAGCQHNNNRKTEDTALINHSIPLAKSLEKRRT